jgi:hypothetical protein
MYTFELHRDIDETGVSGTGVVAQGVAFDDGTVALRWLGNIGSTVVYAHMADVERIHGHNGQTRIVPTSARAIHLDPYGDTVATGGSQPGRHAAAPARTPQGFAPKTDIMPAGGYRWEGEPGPEPTNHHG